MSSSNSEICTNSWIIIDVLIKTSDHYMCKIVYINRIQNKLHVNITSKCHKP